MNVTELFVKPAFFWPLLSEQAQCTVGLLSEYLAAPTSRDVLFFLRKNATSECRMDLYFVLTDVWNITWLTVAPNSSLSLLSHFNCLACVWVSDGYTVFIFHEYVYN